MLAVSASKRPSMSDLKSLSWVQHGRRRMEQISKDACIKKRREEDLLWQAEVEECKEVLLEDGILVTKYGRSGQPHTTRLAVNSDGDIEWQSKFAKRKVLQILHPFSKTSADDSFAESSPLSSLSDGLKSLTVTEYSNKKKTGAKVSCISLLDIKGIHIGHSTHVFTRTANEKSCDPKKCLSLITEKRTLDLSVASGRDRDVLFAALTQLVGEKKSGHLSPFPSLLVSPRPHSHVAAAS